MTVQKMKYLFFSVFMTLSLCISAQNVDSLLVVGDSLRHVYRFEESLYNYNVALDTALEDSTATVSHIQERIRCSENGKNLMFFVDTPVVEAKHKFSIEDFFLYYPLPDKSWRQTPNQLDSLSGPFSNAVYFPLDSERILYSSVDTLGARNIYVTHLVDSVWTKPTLLGDSITSASDDIYPMLSADGKELYFSSRGLYGVGGYDLYVSKWNQESGEWGFPMNMGFPYSSPYDDFLYAPSRDGNHVVFASNRECSSDSVWVYVLKHQYLPVRKDIADSDELKRIMNLNPAGYAERIERKSPVETNIPENLDTKKYLDKITEVRALEDTITVYNERLQKDRNEYALSTDEDERLELTNRILQQESVIPLVQEQLDAAKMQLQKIEMEFLFSGVVIDPDKLLAQADREIVGEATTYTFVKRSFGPEFELKFEPEKDETQEVEPKKK